MNDPVPPITLETLVSHREWVRRVARALVRDEALAEDLEQDAWLEAVRRGPRSDRSLGGWLAAVMRHDLVDTKRSEGRRRLREEAVARPEVQGSTVDLVMAAESHKRVVSALLELEEPYRGTLLLRYFEDKPVREIARLQGTPLETVRTRLRRGIEQLRARFDRENRGERRTWVLALLPALGRDPTTTAGVCPTVPIPATLGGFIMAKKAMAVLAVCALLLFAGGTWLALRAPQSGSSMAGVPPSADGTRSNAAPGTRGGDKDAASEGQEPPRPIMVPEFEFRGAVRGPVGAAPIPWALIEVVPEDGPRLSLVADAEGRFAGKLKGKPTPGTVWAWEPGVGFGRAEMREAAGNVVEQDIPLAALRSQPVEVKFGAICPVRGALVEAWIAGENAPRSTGIIARRRADMEGRCTLNLPPGLPIRLLAHWPAGSRTKEVVLEETPGHDIPVSIVFEPLSPDGQGQIRGSVVGPDGKPIEGLLLVGMGQWSPSMGITGVGATTDASGAFMFEKGWEGEWSVRLRPSVPGDWIHASYSIGRTGEETRIRAVRSGGVRLRVVPAEGAGTEESVESPTLYVLRFVPRDATLPDESWSSLGFGIPPEGLLLPPGAWRLLLAAPGRVRRILDEAAVESGKTLDLGEVPMAMGAQVAGRVSNAEGQPIRAKMFFIPVGSDGRPRPTERVGIYPRVDGSFTSGTDIPPGAGWLLATAEDLAPSVRFLSDLSPGVTSEVGEVRLSPGGSAVLRGSGPGEVRLVRTDGLPCADSVPASPWEIGPESLERVASLDSNGLFLVQHLPAGGYEVRVGGATRRITVREGETTGVDLGASS